MPTKAQLRGALLDLAVTQFGFSLAHLHKQCAYMIQRYRGRPSTLATEMITHEICHVVAEGEWRVGRGTSDRRRFGSQHRELLTLALQHLVLLELGAPHMSFRFRTQYNKVGRFNVPETVRELCANEQVKAQASQLAARVLHVAERTSDATFARFLRSLP